MGEYGIDPRLPKEINDWNSPEHWIRSDLQSALDRGEIDKVNALNKTLQLTLAPGIAAGGEAGATERAKIGITPEMEKIRRGGLPNPEGEKILKGALPAPTTDTTPDYTSLLGDKWSLSGKDLLFK